MAPVAGQPVPIVLDPHGVPPACKQYADFPEAFGYCIAKMAGAFPSIKEVEKACPLAGDWEEECRHAWVAGKWNDESFSIEELLEACGPAEDCRFELVDTRVHPELAVQLDRCRKHAGKHVNDCVGHATQEWYLQEPDADAHAVVAGYAGLGEDRIAYYLAANIACRGVGTCETSSPSMTRFCETAVMGFTNKPQTCPSDERQPLFHNQGTAQGGGGQPGTAPRGPGMGPQDAQNTQGGARPQGLPPGTPPPSHRGE